MALGIRTLPEQIQQTLVQRENTFFESGASGESALVEPNIMLN
jgi:hypothetical protein